MSIRVDTSPLISGAVVVGDPGLGVLAETVPSTGEHGPAYAHPALSFPADAGKEVMGRIVTWPAAGTLTAFEDTSFEFDAPDGSYSFTWQLYLDGVASGAVRTAYLNINQATGIPTLSAPSFAGRIPRVTLTY